MKQVHFIWLNHETKHYSKLSCAISSYDDVKIDTELSQLNVSVVRKIDNICALFVSVAESRFANRDNNSFTMMIK